MPFTMSLGSDAWSIQVRTVTVHVARLEAASLASSQTEGRQI